MNRETGDLEPRLAREWSAADDGLTWTLNLRDDVVFSDNVPFTAADVVFTLQAMYDRRVASPMAGGHLVDRKPLLARAVDDHTVQITFPAPFGPGLRILEDVPILPRHKLEGALRDGSFATAWNLMTPPAGLAGLGPFVLAEYIPGQTMRFRRNPHFWRVDDRGIALPYLDEIDLQIVPEQDAAMLRLESGEVDVTSDSVRPEDLATLRTLAAQGSIHLIDAGVSLDPQLLWFNLAPAAPSAKGRPWLQREQLRRAISSGVDREALANTVYLGAAEPVFGPVTPGAGAWYRPDLPHTDFDPAEAKALLAEIGLVDRDSDGLLEDADGRPAEFSILTQTGNTARERMAAVLQQQLKAIGLTVDIVATEFNTVITRFGQGQYDAMLFSTFTSSSDPASNLDFWMSSGAFHFWNPGQSKPATSWEAEVDDLMRRQSTTLDGSERHRLFADVQRIFAEHLPVLAFAAPRVTVATSARVQGVTPSVLVPPVLWNAEVLSVAPPPKSPGQ